MLKQLHINIPLIEALEKMHSYVKFLKVILSKKRRTSEFETVVLTQKCNAMLQERIPMKMKDPRSFTISCSIGNVDINKALCDLWVNINLMTSSMFKKLGVEWRQKIVTLQLAYGSIAHSEGKIEDVLVKVDKFILP